MKEANEKWPDILAFAFLCISPLLFFGKVLLTGKPLFGSDFISYFWVIKEYIRDSVLIRGELPFWNPYLFSGTPFIANMQASFFYPLGFLYYILPVPLAYVYSTILHCILGNLFMYGFMRSLKVSPWGAALSAWIFGFNGFFMAHIYAGHLTFVQTYIWIPLIFYFLHQFLRSGQIRTILAAGIFLGFQILGGFPQISFYTILGGLLFGIFWFILSLKKETTRRPFRWVSGGILFFSVAFAVAAIQLLPTLEFAGLSTRAGGVTYDIATFDSLHPKELFAFILPDFFGNPVHDTYWRKLEMWHFWETCGYVGILPLVFLFIKNRDDSIRPLRLFSLFTIILAVFLALGKYNPTYPFFYQLPGFDRFRIPAQIIFLYVFGVAIISGISLQGLQGGDWKMSKWLIPAVIGMATALTLMLAGLLLYSTTVFNPLLKSFSEIPARILDPAKVYRTICSAVDRGILLFFGSALLLLVKKHMKVSFRVFGCLTIALVAVDLSSFSSRFIQPFHPAEEQGKIQIFSKLTHKPHEGRVAAVGGVLMANHGLKYRFPSILGYDPLILKRYVYFIQASQGLPFDDHLVHLAGVKRLDSKLIRMLNVKQVIVGDQVISLENDIPYVHFVENVETGSNEEILAQIKDLAFDPKKTVILEIPVSVKREKSEKHVSSLTTSCTVLSYKSDSIRIRTVSNKFAYLVLSEIFYPGWKATVDGEEVSVLRGNYIFRAIPLEKGEHVVHFYYTSRPFHIGLAISLTTIISVLCYFLLGKRRSPKSDRKVNTTVYGGKE